MRIDCAQCGGHLEVTENQSFARCPFCDSSLYVDLSRTWHIEWIRPMLGEAEARGLLERALAQIEVRGVRIDGVRLRHVPFWQVEMANESFAHVARAVVDTELTQIRQVSGNREVLPPESAAALGAEAVDVPLEAVLDERQRHGHLSGTPARVAMVYVPYFEVDYAYGEKQGRAIVDAVSGQVYEDDPPPSPALRLDRRFGPLMLLSLAVFALEAAALGPGVGALAVGVTAFALAWVFRPLIRG